MIYNEVHVQCICTVHVMGYTIFFELVDFLILQKLMQDSPALSGFINNPTIRKQ